MTCSGEMDAMCQHKEKISFSYIYIYIYIHIYIKLYIHTGKMSTIDHQVCWLRSLCVCVVVYFPLVQISKFCFSLTLQTSFNSKCACDLHYLGVFEAYMTFLWPSPSLDASVCQTIYYVWLPCFFFSFIFGFEIPLLAGLGVGGSCPPSLSWHPFCVTCEDNLNERLAYSLSTLEKYGRSQICGNTKWKVRTN